MTYAQAILQPFGILNTLRRKICVPVGLALLARVALTAPEESFVYGAAVVFASTTASFSALLCATCCILLETDFLGSIRACYDSRPWVNMKNVFSTKQMTSEDLSTDNKICPFTHKPPRGTCPICCTVTDIDGYHHGDPTLLHNFMSASMIEYKTASKATDREDNPVMGRIQLDTLLDYKGNFLFATLSPSCKGCFMKSWCWNVNYRMIWQGTILSVNLMLCFFLLKDTLISLHSDLHNTFLCAAVFFATSSVYMLLIIVATSVVFILEHPFMPKCAIPKWMCICDPWIKELLYSFAAPSARFGANPTRDYWKFLHPKPIPS